MDVRINTVIEELVTKYREIKSKEKLDFVQLRKRIEADKLSKSKASNILDQLFIEQEDQRYERSNKRNSLIGILSGGLLILLSIYFYFRTSGLDIIPNARGIGWNEMQFFACNIVIFCTGVYFISISRHIRNRKRD